MTWLGQQPIKRKLGLVVVISCLAVLVPMCVALAFYQVHDFRSRLERDTTVLADVVARNSEASLTFEDVGSAQKTLQAIDAESFLGGAQLYDVRGEPFALYIRPGANLQFPEHAPPPGSEFGPAWLVVARPVEFQGKFIGTICLQASLQGIRDRLRWSAEIGFPVLLACVLGALFVSLRLQHSITDPILALAQTAKSVAEKRDYTVRAVPQGPQEIGVLTDAFNLMLKQIQEQNQDLNYERDLLATLMENLPDSIYFKDPQSRYRHVSRSKMESAFAVCLARYHATHAEGGGTPLPEHLTSLDKFARYLENKSDADFFNEEDARFNLEEEQEIIRTGMPVIGKIERARLLDGRLAWFMSAKMPWRDRNGKIIGTFGSSKNITAIKETEQRLQTQLERLRLLDQITRSIGERQDLPSIFHSVLRRLEDQMPVDFACVCNHSPSAEHLAVTSVGAKSVSISHSMGIPENAKIPVHQDGFSRCLKGYIVYEPNTSKLGFPFTKALSSAGLHSVVLAPLQVESQIFGILVAARREVEGFSSADCEFLKQLSEHVALASHQSQLYTALQNAFDELRQTQQAVMQQERLRALGEMASGIAHDINNAIAPVSLYTESLLETEPNLSERARSYLETIQRSIDDVAHTVSRMKEFYRQREPQLTFAPANVNLMVEQVVDISRARWSDIPQQRGKVIKLTTKLEADLPPVMGVESEIREALVNLIFNATDAMPEGGALRLRTRLGTDKTGRESVIVEVTDTGIGMDEETRRRCLEPFFTTKGERGTGLGLAMVYGIVRRHGGEIEIDSELGCGATFRLFLPAGSHSTEEPPAVAPTAAPPRQVVLVVDDDPVLIRSLRDILENDGHDVTCAGSGQEGIKLFRVSLEKQKPFAIVFTDLGMPGVDGRQVAAAIKALSPHTPVIMLTGWGERMVEEGEVPADVNQILSKPPKLRDLRQAMNKCLAPQTTGGALA